MQTALTHKDRDWCVLPPDHEGRCQADWEYKHEEHQKMFQNYRGRRYIACRAVADLWSVIENLGIEDGSQLPMPDRPFNPVPSEQVRAELQNMANALLRMTLILNDGQVSHSKLNAF